MAATIYPDFPPKLNNEELTNLLVTLNDWAIAHGLAVRPSPAFVPTESDPSAVLAVTAPVTLFPSPFPKACFEEATKIQKAYNELYASISRDEDWLGEIVKELVKVDDFIAKLWNIHLMVKQEGYVQELSLGLFRSDYMVHVDPNDPKAVPQIKQVEFNTIASSFGGLSSQVSLLHKHMLLTGAYPASSVLRPQLFPMNDATSSLAAGLSVAHAAYGGSRTTESHPRCVLFVVQSPERNIFDQRHIEYALQAEYIPTFRLPFSEVLIHTKISSEPSRPLIYTPPHSPSTPYEVSVLYFRSTYTPDDYPDAAEWEARYQLERSSAIKCPSILTHLAGSKKIQQVLATPSSPHLARFIHDPDTAKAVNQTFAAIYPLDSSEAGQKAKQLATSPELSQGFVLKPQREGGGNNIYRTAIPDFLKALGSEDKWAGHILMELIETPSQRNMIIREGVVKSGEVVTELGVYGTCLWRQSGEVVHNEQAGYLLRTKGRESEEGGVAAGFGAVDSISLLHV